MELIESNTSQNSETLNQVLSESNKVISGKIEEKERKRRGRQPGSTVKKKEVSQEVPNQYLVKYDKNQYKMALAGVFTLSGMFLAKATNFPGFALSPEETDALATQGGEACEVMFPQVDTRYVAVGGFALSIIAVYGLKVHQYNEHVAEIKKKQASLVKTEKAS